MFNKYGDTHRVLMFFAILIVAGSSRVMAFDEQAMIDQIRTLDWQTEPNRYQLTGADASLTTNAEEYLLKEKDAHAYMRITEGHDGFKPDAVVVRVQGPHKNTQVIYTYHEIGYVKMDDWEEHIDKDELLSEIKKSTEAANKIKAEGYSSLYVDGWAQEPYLDKENAIIYWAIMAHSSEGTSLVNAKAMRLGRKGFSEIVWMGVPEQFANAQASLAPALEAYQYNEGATYADFVPGKDAVAAVGAGALAYKLITGKVATKAGAGILALLAIFAKKLWFLIFIPFIWIWRWFKGFFAGKKSQG